MLPPSNVEGRKSDKDSGEKNGTHPNYSNKNQLFSNAHVELNTSNGNVSAGITNSQLRNLQNKMKKRIERKVKNQNWHVTKLCTCCRLTTSE